MRKKFKNAKAKHGLNKKKLDKSNWSPILRDQKRKRREEKGRRRRRGRGREEEEKRRSSRKIQRYGTLYIFVWINVCVLWVVRNLTLK